jgi:hypothetical protein
MATIAPKKPVRFDQRLVLNSWFLSLFDVDSFEKLSLDLKNPNLEGYDENNQSRIFIMLVNRTHSFSGVTEEQLRRYDDNIYTHTNRISEKRASPLSWKYFQYLSLLATEVYLDKWFTNKGELCTELNQYLATFNETLPSADRIESFTVAGLSKLAFWSATGSGKTLLMHVHMLQFQHYAKKHKTTKDINKIILITPNEGLSAQHLQELIASNIPAQIFAKDVATGSLFGGYGNEKPVEIIEYTKLRESSKEKTVALESFESNNLVFIDEGHRGAGGDVIKKYRDVLSENGFAFEYSATFGQSIKAAGTTKRKLLEQEYAKAILFDYSYRYFYRDGYGKDYKILNLQEEQAHDENLRTLYLTAGLLTFYQQVKLYGSDSKAWRTFLLERPLWVFVGGKVTAVRKEGGREVSDVVDILLFIKSFIENKDESLRNIKNLLTGKTGLTDGGGRDVLASSFDYIQTLSLDAKAIFTEIQQEVFRSRGGQLHLDNLKGIDGEIGVRVGNSEYFGVINVGDDKQLLKLCETNGLSTSEVEFKTSLFKEINKDSSTVNLLIGSKKFTEGWSSWRVSLMGLMNIGRSEGSEIIQLFGRGVRLKGKGMSLKRSKAIEGANAPKHIQILETLNIFGVRADYMKTFKEYLEEEGLPTGDMLEINLPVIKAFDPSKRLKVLRIREGKSFKRDGGKVDFVFTVDKRIAPVEIDCYPKLQSLVGGVSQGVSVEPDMGVLTSTHFAFFDFDELYFDLQKYKNEKSWYNINLSVTDIKNILNETGWYKLYIPKQLLLVEDFDRVRYWQEITLSLLKKYLVALYNFRKSEWEEPYLEYQEMVASDPNFIDEYQVTLPDDADHNMVANKIRSLAELLTKIQKSNNLNELKQIPMFAYGGFTPFTFDRHLYHPLIHIEAGIGLQLTVKPVHLNEGEYQFISDLQSYYQKYPDIFANRELFLLRNKSKEGIGFFEAGNFYPDFIMWVIDGDTQHVVFVDPKGIRNLDLEDDLKLNFHKKIKEKETQLGDANTKLYSYIVSGTPYELLVNNKNDQKSLEAKNILFQQQGNDYIQKMFNGIIG